MRQDIALIFVGLGLPSYFYTEYIVSELLSCI